LVGRGWKSVCVGGFGELFGEIEEVLEAVGAGEGNY
jgi:hypothetical protein